MTAPDLPADPAALVDLARPLAQEVAAHLVAGLDRTGPRVTAKSTPTDLVTELDTWAERHITERLLAVRPHDGVEGEEEAIAAINGGRIEPGDVVVIRYCGPKGGPGRDR